MQAANKKKFLRVRIDYLEDVTGCLQPYCLEGNDEINENMQILLEAKGQAQQDFNNEESALVGDAKPKDPNSNVMEI